MLQHSVKSPYCRFSLPLQMAQVNKTFHNDALGRHIFKNTYIDFQLATSKLLFKSHKIRIKVTHTTTFRFVAMATAKKPLHIPQPAVFSLFVSRVTLFHS
jgi:hypothetical protein